MNQQVEKTDFNFRIIKRKKSFFLTVLSKGGNLKAFYGNISGLNW